MSIDAAAFPHIIDGIFAAADPAALRNLRVCRDWATRADARVTLHLAIRDEALHAVRDQTLYPLAPLSSTRAQEMLDSTLILDVLSPPWGSLHAAAFATRVRPAPADEREFAAHAKIESRGDLLILLPPSPASNPRVVPGAFPPTPTAPAYSVTFTGRVGRVVHHFAPGSPANPHPTAPTILVIHDIASWDEATMHRFLQSPRHTRLLWVVGTHLAVPERLLPVVAQYFHLPQQPHRVTAFSLAHAMHTWEHGPTAWTFEGWEKFLGNAYGFALAMGL